MKDILLFIAAVVAIGVALCSIPLLFTFDQILTALCVFCVGVIGVVGLVWGLPD